jgi:oligopeptide transport system substrate-binding protein
MKTRFPVVLVVFLSISIIMTASVSAQTSVSPRTATSGLVPAAVTLNLNLGGEPANLDPALTDDSPSQNVVEQLFVGLVRLDNDTGEVRPELAKSWTVTDYGTTYTFKLRGDVSWTDGSPVTAQDVRYGILRSLAPATGSPYAYVLDPIKNATAFHNGTITDPNRVGVVALDQTHLRIKLGYQASYILSILAMPVARPTPQSAIDEWGSAWTDPAHIVTNGAYRLSEWAHNDHILLDKSPTYFDSANVQIDQAKMFMVDDATAWTMYQSGQLDTAVVPSGTPIDDSLRPRVHFQPSGCTEYYGFTVKKAPFNNTLVRKAFIAAVDRQGLVDNVVGAGKPALPFISPGIFGYPGDLGIPYNPTKAKKWLAQAGFPNGSGLPAITLWYNTNASKQAVAEYVKSNWETNLGASISLQSLDWTTYLQELPKGNWQVWRLGWCPDYPDGNNYDRDVFRSNSSNNNTKWKNTVFDNLVDSAAVQQSLATRKDLYKQAETILVKTDAVIIPLYYDGSYVAAKRYLDRTYPESYMNAFDISTWHITPLTTIENDDNHIRYNGWRGIDDPAANGGSIRVSNIAYDTATFAFDGTSVDWITRKAPDQGKATVKIDGVSKGTFDLYAKTAQPNFKQTFDNLANGSHKLVVKVLHTKNTNATGFDVVVDAFGVGGGTTQDDDADVKYDTWSGGTNASASGGDYRLSSANTATASFTFVGSNVDWITTKGPSYGLAAVLIDSKSSGTYDLYQAGEQWKVAITFSGLAYGKHTIQIKPLAMKNAASTGTAIVVDAFYGPITPQ